MARWSLPASSTESPSVMKASAATAVEVIDVATVVEVVFVEAVAALVVVAARLRGSDQAQ